MIRPSRIVLAVLVTSAMLAACRRQPEPPPAPVGPPPVNQDSIDAENRRQAEAAARARAREDSIAAANRRRADSIEAANRLAAENARRMEEARRALTQMINFDYNEAAIRDADRAILEAKLPVLNANPGLRIRISGHADERGSDEYNVALGQRRAAAAKRFLTDRGVAESRIDVVSYGEERPMAMGSDEGSWAQNRRAEFEITAGGNAISVPR
jgi:peptidoglycan-associated lipoprotein